MNTTPVLFDHDKLIDALRQIEPRLCILLGFACAEPLSRSIMLGASVEAHQTEKSLDTPHLRRVH